MLGTVGDNSHCNTAAALRHWWDIMSSIILRWWPTSRTSHHICRRSTRFRSKTNFKRGFLCQKQRFVYSGWITGFPLMSLLIVERSAAFILDGLLESSQSQLILNFFTLWPIETFLRGPKSPHFSPTYT